MHLDAGLTVGDQPAADAFGADAAPAGALKIAMVGCPFRTTYGAYIASLRAGLARLGGSPVQWIASNCGCGDPIEIARDFQTRDCDYFETASAIGAWNIVGYSPNPMKRALKSGFRNAGNQHRARRFAALGQRADVIHFQQTLGAFGSDVAFRLLRQPGRAAKVVTLHELDPEQTSHPERNLAYNLADALIVHDSWMKQRLVTLGIAAERVHVVCCGTDLGEGEPAPRDGLVFYGGHNLNKGKGLDLLFAAYALLKARSVKAPPRLKIHGHYGKTTPAYGLELAAGAGVADDVDWLNELSAEAMARLYRRSQALVLPYKGSFGGLAAGVAAANRLPIIATRFAGIPDHVGDLGVWIGGDDPAELADRLEQGLGDDAFRRDLGARLRAHAERRLGWDAVARDTLAVYRAACDQAAKRPG